MLHALGSIEAKDALKLAMDHPLLSQQHIAKDSDGLDRVLIAQRKEKPS